MQLNSLNEQIDLIRGKFSQLDVSMKVDEMCEESNVSTVSMGARPKIMVRAASPPPTQYSKARGRSNSLPLVNNAKIIECLVEEKEKNLRINSTLPVRDMLERMPLPDSHVRRKSTDFSMLQNLGSIAEQD